jgi:hypothetical protein
MFICRASIGVTAALASAAACAAVGAGDHLFLHARILDCDEATHLIDHTQVAESGEASFSNGVTLQVSGMEPQEIATALGEKIRSQIGCLPRTPRIEVVPDADSERVVRNLQVLLNGTGCEPRPERLERPIPTTPVLTSLSRPKATTAELPHRSYRASAAFAASTARADYQVPVFARLFHGSRGGSDPLF